MAEQKNKIGWNLPEDCIPCQGHEPSAPCGFPDLPHIPNSTSAINPTPCLESPVQQQGRCKQLSEPGFIVPIEEHLLGRPINLTKRPEKKFQTDRNEFWIAGTQGSIPAGAVEGGQEESGEPLYIARAEFKGSLTPGKLNSEACYISWGSDEHKVEHYEVLAGVKGSWVRSDRDKIPENALKAGYSEDGEDLFIGRVNHKGKLTPGKVHASHRVCYIPFGGKELSFQAYDIFVVDE